VSDIVERLRAWVYTDSLYATASEAADEIERLRLSASGSCPSPENAANEDKVFSAQNMTTLTPAERCVLREVRHGYADIDDVRCNEIAFVIDGLLSRTGANDADAGEEAAKPTVKSKKLPERDRLVRSLEARMAELRTACRAGVMRNDLRESEQIRDALVNAVHDCRAHIARLRFTDAEREAIKDAISCCEDITYGGAADQEAADVLKALLERLRGGE
jgi:hypothetical protein